MQEQEKLKQKIYDQQQQQPPIPPQLQQHSIVPLTPESVAQFLATQNQSQVSDDHPWSIHHSISAPSFLSFNNDQFYSSDGSVKSSMFLKSSIFLSLSLSLSLSLA